MYYPVLRGKQNELIALRELAPHLSPDFFRPIIEPVRDKFSAISKTIEALNDKNISPVIIVNPTLGDFSVESDYSSVIQELGNDLSYLPCFTTKNTSNEKLTTITKGLDHFSILVEEGVSRDILPILEKADIVFSSQYQRSAFKTLNKVVIIRDGFSRASRNSDYPERSFFSDIHTDFKEGKNVIGFGDYTITGDDYKESGGPAYVVAIHLSYIDQEEFGAMYVRHFKSYDDRTPTGPGKKFGDALDQLIVFSKENEEFLYDTIGLNGFKKLHSEGHFPGLGQVKKLSIQNHIETICTYLSGE